MKNRILLALGLPIAAVFGFWLNLFVIGPMIVDAGHMVLNNIVYLVFRLGTFIFLGYALAKWAGRGRAQALSSVMLVGAFDQVLLKGLWMIRDVKKHPELWTGVSMEPTVLFVGLAQGYLFFFPFVLILAFLGIELTRFGSELKEDRERALEPLQSTKKR